MSDAYLDILGNLYSRHYLATRDTIEKDQSALHLLLNDWKHTRPDDKLPNKKALKLEIELLKKLGWSHWARAQQAALKTKFPSDMQIL